jgi:hypothetical protein
MQGVATRRKKRSPEKGDTHNTFLTFFYVNKFICYYYLSFVGHDVVFLVIFKNCDLLLITMVFVVF